MDYVGTEKPTKVKFAVRLEQGLGDGHRIEVGWNGGLEASRGIDSNVYLRRVVLMMLRLQR